MHLNHIVLAVYDKKTGDRIEMKAKIIIRVKFELSVNRVGCDACCIKKSTQNNPPEKQWLPLIITLFSKNTETTKRHHIPSGFRIQT